MKFKNEKNDILGVLDIRENDPREMQSDIQR